MDLIIETDLGRDPDDFFAILWLLAVGVNVRAITISPGDPDQIANATFLRKHFDLDFQVGVAKLGRDKCTGGSIHYDIKKKYGYPLEDEGHDGWGPHVVADTKHQFPDSEFLIIGPVTSIGTYLSEHGSCDRATMQGGFLPYHLYTPSKRLEKFEGKHYVGTFNLNGDRKAAQHFMDADIPCRMFVSKNVCHTVVYDTIVHKRIKPTNAYAELFKEAMDLYLAKRPNKKFHDPTAAVCHLDPDIATWVKGRVVKCESGWTTELDDEGDYIIADIDYDRLWESILNFEVK